MGVWDSYGRPVRYGPVLWSRDTITTLQSLIPANAGWTLQIHSAYAKTINDSGQLVGSGMFIGKVRAFIMTPLKPTP